MPRRVFPPLLCRRYRWQPGFGDLGIWGCLRLVPVRAGKLCRLK
ncbi:hypothetical protein [Kamptonema formosum]|nr:hypothetical protein [Oscillatoria sp. PCC 10802]